MVTGLGFDYRQSLQMTLDRLATLLNLDPTKSYQVLVRDGFDAFRVSWYQQVTERFFRFTLNHLVLL